MIFFEDENSFTLNSTPFKSETEFATGLWLTLVGTNEIPPHIALISDGKYYSLSAYKVDCGSPVERVINILERKQIPSLFIQFKTTVVGLQNFEPLQWIYKNLQPLESIDNTCLSPIKEFFTENISNDFADVNYVFELLALSENKGLIKECISLFCENTNSNRITLPKYTKVQIRNKIHELSSKQPTLITK